jgi:hypothetical protein
MSVASSVGTVGGACQPFQCLPYQTLANLGEHLNVTVYGSMNMPYVLFLGLPGEYCQVIPGIAGELGVAFPIYTVGIGTVGVYAPVSVCNTASAITQVQVANYLPLGTQFRLQVLSVDDNGLGFSRAVEIHTR